MIGVRLFCFSAILVLIGGSAFGSVVISFTDGENFDQTGIGEFMSLSDGTNLFSLTTVDIIDVHGYSASTYSVIKTSISTANEFGINSGGSTYGDSSTTSFNNGEAWVAAFNTTVCLDSITVTALGDGDSFSLTILDGSNSGKGTIIALVDGVNEINQTIMADTSFKLAAGSDSGTVRVSQISVTPVTVNKGFVFLLTGKKSLQQRQLFHLYLLIGQSNMAGRGTVGEEDLRADPRVLTLNESNQWIEAVDPIHFDKPAIDGVGPGVSFGKMMAAAIADTNIVIGLIPCAVGGTSVSQWQKDADPTDPWGVLYSNALIRAQTALKDGVLKGILWHQGEADCSSNNIAAYETRVTQLVSDFRQDLDALDVPFIAGEVGVWSNNTARAAFNANLEGLSGWILNSAVVSSEGLNDIGDGTHFDSESQHTMGQHYAEAMIQLQAHQ